MAWPNNLSIFYLNTEPNLGIRITFYVQSYHHLSKKYLLPSYNTLFYELRTEQKDLCFPTPPQTLKKKSLVLMPQQRYINIFHNTDILSFLSSHSETNNWKQDKLKAK